MIFSIIWLVSLIIVENANYIIQTLADFGIYSASRAVMYVRAKNHPVNSHRSHSISWRKVCRLCWFDFWRLANFFLFFPNQLLFSFLTTTTAASGANKTKWNFTYLCVPLSREAFCNNWTTTEISFLSRYIIPPWRLLNPVWASSNWRIKAHLRMNERKNNTKPTMIMQCRDWTSTASFTAHNEHTNDSENISRLMPIAKISRLFDYY